MTRQGDPARYRLLRRREDGECRATTRTGGWCGGDGEHPRPGASRGLRTSAGAEFSPATHRMGGSRATGLPRALDPERWRDGGWGGRDPAVAGTRRGDRGGFEYRDSPPSHLRSGVRHRRGADAGIRAEHRGGGEVCHRTFALPGGGSWRVARLPLPGTGLDAGAAQSH
jgi:hypothetical protein